MLERWEVWSTPLLQPLPGSLWPGIVAPDRFLSMGLRELNCILMLNLIAWNKTILTSTLRPYTKLNCLNGTVFVCWTELFAIELFFTLKLYLCWTELFAIELFFTLKLYLCWTELFEILYLKIIRIRLKYLIISYCIFCPVSWGCRIHWLHLCRGVRPPPQRVSWYDTKQSHGEVPAVLELWGMRSTPSLPSLPGPLWRGLVALILPYLWVK